MNVIPYRTLYGAIERGARAIDESGVDTSRTQDCWQVLIDQRININGYGPKAEWFFDRVIERVDELRAIRAEALTTLASINAELIGDAA